jgi:hypothetical protein
MQNTFERPPGLTKVVEEKGDATIGQDIEIQLPDKLYA